MPETRKLRHYLFAVLITILATALLFPLQQTLTLANFALIYLLVVLLIAMRQGTGPALLAAVASFFLFNFFLIRPYYTLAVADPRELLDLVIYLIIAILTGQLAASARREAENARQRAYEQNILYELTSIFNQLNTHDKVYEGLSRVLHERLNARQVYVLPYETDLSSSDQTIAYLVLRGGDRVYGTVCVGFSDASVPLRLVNACVVQAAAALERIDLVERAQKNKTLEEADKLKTALLHAVSHDLRTPITIIKTSANNLLNLSSSLPETERNEMVKSIEDEADHLNKMVGNLLDLSRLNAGALTINDNWNSVEEIAGDIAALTFQRTHEQKIKIIIPADFPMLRLDYGLILQAMGNLVDNALRYEPSDKQVEIRAHIIGQEVQVAIVNHGPSIKLDELEHIWEPFFHGEKGQTGLGLAIARGIVEAHGGRLWHEETPGGGATFIIALPLKIMSEVNQLENSGR